MNILVIARSAWRDDNSVGRTLSDFFESFSHDDIYSITLRDASPDNKIAKQNFSISEMQQIKHILSRSPIGVLSEGNISVDNKTEQNAYNRAKKRSLMILSFLREWLWGLGMWKNNNLNQYLDQIKPDVIFMPVYPCWYAHRLLKFVQNKTGAKVAIFHADDTYTLKQYSWSPLFWTYRFIQRKWVRSTVRQAEVNYVISDIQKQDYDRCFGVENKVLTKFAEFHKDPQLKTQYGNPIKLVYTGNINLNRWKSLSMIATCLKKINIDGPKAILEIYSATPLTGDMKIALNIQGTSKFCGEVSATEVSRIQKEADILVHVEAFDKKNKFVVRQSFSTKIVDYLAASRPILAVGPGDVASIYHLKKNNAAFVATSKDELDVLLPNIIFDKKLLSSMALAAYECGRRCHNKTNIQDMLVADLHSLIS